MVKLKDLGNDITGLKALGMPPDTLNIILTKLDVGTIRQIAESVRRMSARPSPSPLTGKAVQLISGGPHMTCGSDPDENGMVECLWFQSTWISGGPGPRIEREKMPVIALKLAPKKDEENDDRSARA